VRYDARAMSTALLVLDYQVDVVAMLGDKGAACVERTAAAIASARAAGTHVIYVVIGFRPGYPEISPNNALFAGLSKSGRFAAGSPGTEIVAALRPHDGDVVVTKHRVSAFAGTDLDMILRAKGVDRLVLAGLSTSGIVLSTTRHADADYRLVILKDCCADGDDEVHRVLTEKVLARQATVIAAADLPAHL
jgi:nicotinamidase-related amidase